MVSWRCIVHLTAWSVAAVQASFVPSHSFPDRDHRGRDTANEFQLVEVGNIKRAEAAGVGVGVGAAGVYAIDTVSPLFIDNDDLVQITFTSDQPAINDWIAAYSPPDVDITTTVPVKYGWCSDDANYKVSNSGTLHFNFTNLRAGIKFYYFSNGTHYPILVGESADIVNFNNINEQLRPRVTATGDVNALNISWSSNLSSIPRLRYGTVSGSYTEEIPASTTIIQQSQMCNAPANTTGWRDLGEIHTATLVGAAALANTAVYYIFGDVASDNWSKEYVLFLPPLPGTQPPTRPTTVILYDDMGRGTQDNSYTWNEYGRPSVFTAMAVGAEVNKQYIDSMSIIITIIIIISIIIIIVIINDSNTIYNHTLEYI
jgi:hypothetical protein